MPFFDPPDGPVGITWNEVEMKMTKTMTLRVDDGGVELEGVLRGGRTVRFERAFTTFTTEVACSGAPEMVTIEVLGANDYIGGPTTVRLWVTKDAARKLGRALLAATAKSKA